MHDYSRADLTRLFGLPVSLVASLVRAQYLTATTTRGRTRYTFVDPLILRIASAVKPASRQHPLPLRGAETTVVALIRPRAPLQAHIAAAGHYARGHALEQSDVTAARAAYLDALNAYNGHLDARINLGRLLHLAGDLPAAEKVYRAAKHSSALLAYNLAILLEDLNREEEAIASYREALARDPTLHDAHFNLSRLHERAKQPREALRHLLAYRRHVARHGENR